MTDPHSLSACAHPPLRRTQARMEHGATAWAGAAVAALSGGGRTMNISKTASIMTCAWSTTPASIPMGPRMNVVETIGGGTGTIAVGSGGRRWTTIWPQPFDLVSQSSGSRAPLLSSRRRQ
eukprot:8672486-Pyramimonas_sp.AAC.1